MAIWDDDVNKMLRGLASPFSKIVKSLTDGIDGNNIPAAIFGKIRVNNDSFVASAQSEDVSLSTGTPEVIPFNTEEKDVLDEFDNSTGTFVPEESGFYVIFMHAEFAVNSDQDELKLDVYDVEAEDTICETEERSSGSGNRDRGLTCCAELESGKSYQFRATNEDNNDTVNGKTKRTRLRIKKERFL